MLRNFRYLLAEQTPDLLARSQLSRKDAAYLTHRQAFDLHRKNRLDELKNNAADLYRRINLPHTHRDQITDPLTHSRYAVDGNSRESPSDDSGVDGSNKG